MAAGPGSLENRPLTDSPEKTPLLGVLRASNESPEWGRVGGELHVKPVRKDGA